jgi:hypothetical protein
MTAKRWATYTGKDGEFHAGIPARHLTDEDREVMTAEERKLVEQSPIYKVAGGTTSEKGEAQ